MNDPLASAEPRAVDPLDRPLTELTVDELMELKDAYEARGIRIYNSLWTSPDMLALLGVVGVYSKAFLETLAKHHADAVAEMLRTSFRKNGSVAEVHLSVDSDTAAMLALTEDLPDEARLALLDLDVTAEDVRGKILRWDHETSSWRPAGDGQTL